MADDARIVREHYGSGKERCKVMSKDKGNVIIEQLVAGRKTQNKFSILQGEDNNTFRLMVKLPEKKRNVSDQTVYGNYRTVAYIEDFFDILKECHINAGHLGQRKTRMKVHSTYDYVPEEAIKKFVEMCPVCSRRKPQKNKAPLTPIISPGYLSRAQIDLISMENQPDDDFKYIGHYLDHFTKHQVLFPLKTKSGEEVAVNLKRIFAVLGAPKILQSDNGREFCNRVIKDLIDNWHGQISFVNGRPYKPTTQGAVESSHRTVRRLLQARMAETNQSNWAEWLDEFTYIINSTVHDTTNKTPFELLSGVPPREAFFPGMPRGLLMEEDIQEMVQTEECTDDVRTPDETSDGNIQGDVDTEGTDVDYIDDTNIADDDLSTEERIVNVRRVALENYVKSAKKMKEKYNKLNNVNNVTFEVGDFVTVKVPNKARKRTDLPRIVGLIVSKTSHKVPQYRIRTYTGVIRELVSFGSIEKYSGLLDISMENWKNCPKISYKDALRQSTGTANGAESGTADTFEHTYSASSPVPDESFPHQRTAPFYEQLLAEEFSENSCGVMKEVLDTVTLTALQSTCSAIVSACPPIPNVATSINIPRLGVFGDGYSSYIPESCKREGLVPLRSSTTGNSCLYNSISILLYGDEKKSEFLRLLTTCAGVLYHQEIVKKITQKFPEKEDVLTWANHVTTDQVMEDVRDCEAREIVEHVVLQELKMSLQNLRDSAEIQMIALATLLKRPIQQNINHRNFDHCKELIEPVRCDEVLQPLQILWVPCSPNVSCREVVFNHIVPLARSDRLEYQLPDPYDCGARQMDRCAFKDGAYPDVPRPLQIQCNICQTWYHVVCLDVNAANYKGRPFHCGCDNASPFQSNRSAFYGNWLEIKSKLDGIDIKGLQKKLLNPSLPDGIPSLRFYINSKKGSYFRLRQELKNCLFGPFTDEQIIEYIHLHVALECQRLKDDDLIMNVILPEVIVRLVQSHEGCNKLQAEILLKS